MLHSSPPLRLCVESAEIREVLRAIGVAEEKMAVKTKAARKTFHQWADDAIPSTPHIKDFLCDWRHDREHPRRIKTCSALVGYLRSCSACFEAIEAAQAAWKQYQQEA